MKRFPFLISLAATVVWLLPVVDPFTTPAGASVITIGNIDPAGIGGVGPSNIVTRQDPWNVSGI